MNDIKKSMLMVMLFCCWNNLAITVCFDDFWQVFASSCCKTKSVYTDRWKIMSFILKEKFLKQPNNRIINLNESIKIGILIYYKSFYSLSFCYNKDIPFLLLIILDLVLCHKDKRSCQIHDWNGMSNFDLKHKQIYVMTN